MPDLANLNYAPLSAKPSAEELTAYRAPRETPGYDFERGFNEQKAPASKKGLFGQPTNQDVWARRYRFSAFAEANGMTYVFRLNPSRWPGKSSKQTTLEHALQGQSAEGLPFMTCFEEDETEPNGTAGRAVYHQGYLVVAVKAHGTTPQAFLKHNRQAKAGAAGALESHFKLSDPYTPDWSPKNIGKLLEAVKPYFPPELLDVILSAAPGYDLHLSGGWLYLMRPNSFTQGRKTNFDPGLLRERFEIAAAVGPVFDQIIGAGPR